MELDYHPTTRLNVLVPSFRKVVRGFQDTGDYWLMLHFYQGGLRTPRIFDAGDKQKVKKELSDFLRVLGKPQFTGQIKLHMKHGEFTDYFSIFPGTGRYDAQKKEGIHYSVTSTRKENCSYSYILEKRIIKINPPFNMEKILSEVFSRKGV